MAGQKQNGGMENGGAGAGDIDVNDDRKMARLAPPAIRRLSGLLHPLFYVVESKAAAPPHLFLEGRAGGSEGGERRSMSRS